jgi:hypothetical protein
MCWRGCWFDYDLLMAKQGTTSHYTVVRVIWTQCAAVLNGNNTGDKDVDNGADDEQSQKEIQWHQNVAHASLISQGPRSPFCRYYSYLISPQLQMSRLCIQRMP